MVVNLHFRKSDYEQYVDFSKLSPFGEDVKTTVYLPPGLYSMYHYLLDKLKGHTITLYCRKGGNVFSYESLTPPHRKAVLQRMLSQHLALEYWLPRVKNPELYSLLEKLSTKGGNVLVRLDRESSSLVPYQNDTKKTTIVLNISAKGMFSHPSLIANPIFPTSYAFSYALAKYLLDSPLVPSAWKQWLSEFVSSLDEKIDETLDEVVSFLQVLIEKPPAVEDILYEYLLEHKSVTLTPIPPLPLVTNLQKYGYDVYDLQEGVRHLLDKGIVDVTNEVLPSGVKKFKKIKLREVNI